MIYAMSYGIVGVNLVSLLGLFATLILGYALDGALHGGAEREVVVQAFSRHFLLALSSTLLAIFGQSMTFFYFIGTGKSIKTAVAAYGLDPEYAQRTRVFKQRTSGPAFLALLAVMAAFIIGGGVASGAVPAWVHHLLAWGALGAHGFAGVGGARVIRENTELLDELDRIIAERSRRGEIEVKRAVV